MKDEFSKMEIHDLASKNRGIIQYLSQSKLGKYVDANLEPPAPFQGTGEIKLIVLGQDPTIRRAGYRKNVKTTLLLNQPGHLRDYLSQICTGLDLVLDKNVYATNLFKNFFIQPPDQYRSENPRFLEQFTAVWAPLLLDEILIYPNVPVLTLGEPVFNCLLKEPDWVQIRHYWGYAGPKKYNENFQIVKPEENVLNRIIFPFPHVHGQKKHFYQTQMKAYLHFLSKLMV